MYFDGTMSRRASENRLELLCKRFIAQALRENGFELSEQGVMIEEGPVLQRETFERLKSEELAYPTTKNRLDRLKCVWAVKGRHLEKKDQLVELLVAEYDRGFIDLMPLGRLDGDKWVSPLV